MTDLHLAQIELAFAMYAEHLGLTIKEAHAKYFGELTKSRIKASNVSYDKKVGPSQKELSDVTVKVRTRDTNEWALYGHRKITES